MPEKYVDICFVCNKSKDSKLIICENCNGVAYYCILCKNVTYILERKDACFCPTLSIDGIRGGKFTETSLILDWFPCEKERKKKEADFKKNNDRKILELISDLREIENSLLATRNRVDAYSVMFRNIQINEEEKGKDVSKTTWLYYLQARINDCLSIVDRILWENQL